MESKNNQSIFSKLSFINSLALLGIMSYFIMRIPSVIKASEGLPEPSLLLIIATHLLCVTGLLMTILSFTKKEPSTWFKWVGAILNGIIFLLIEGSAIFALVI
nr:hypothetical protein [Saprospiraceae bacterium]